MRPNEEFDIDTTHNRTYTSLSLLELLRDFICEETSTENEEDEDVEPDFDLLNGCGCILDLADENYGNTIGALKELRKSVRLDIQAYHCFRREKEKINYKNLFNIVSAKISSNPFGNSNLLIFLEEIFNNMKTYITDFILENRKLFVDYLRNPAATQKFVNENRSVNENVFVFLKNFFTIPLSYQATASVDIDKFEKIIIALDNQPTTQAKQTDELAEFLENHPRMVLDISKIFHDMKEWCEMYEEFQESHKDSEAETDDEDQSEIIKIVCNFYVKNYVIFIDGFENTNVVKDFLSLSENKIFVKFISEFRETFDGPESEKAYKMAVTGKLVEDGHPAHHLSMNQTEKLELFFQKHPSSLDYLYKNLETMRNLSIQYNRFKQDFENPKIIQEWLNDDGFLLFFIYAFTLAKEPIPTENFTFDKEIWGFILNFKKVFGHHAEEIKLCLMIPDYEGKNILTLSTETLKQRKDSFLRYLNKHPDIRDYLLRGNTKRNIISLAAQILSFRARDNRQRHFIIEDEQRPNKKLKISHQDEGSSSQRLFRLKVKLPSPENCSTASEEKPFSMT